MSNERKEGRVRYWENVSILLNAESRTLDRRDVLDGVLSAKLMGHIKEASSYFEESARVYPEISAFKRTVTDRASGAIEIVRRSGISELCHEYLLREFDVFRGRFSEF